MGKVPDCESLCAQQSQHGHCSRHLDKLGGGNMVFRGLLVGKGLHPARGGTMPLKAVSTCPTHVDMKDIGGTNVKRRIFLSLVE